MGRFFLIQFLINMSNSTTIQIKEVKRIYISGKISGLDILQAKCNFAMACVYVIIVHNADFVENPFKIKPFLGIKCWLCYMINDIRRQRKCTHSAFQSNWLESRGAVIEYFFAKFIFKHKIVFLFT